MAYIKQNFADGEVLLAEHLNKIEEQIALNEELINDKADIDDVLTNSGTQELSKGNLIILDDKEVVNSDGTVTYGTGVGVSVRRPYNGMTRAAGVFVHSDGVAAMRTTEIDDSGKKTVLSSMTLGESETEFINPVNIASGGTGATSASEALENLGGLEIVDARGAEFDMNELFTSGAHCKIYRTNEKTLNTPHNLGYTTFYGSRILSLTSSSTYGKQIAYVMGKGNFERTLNNGAIGDWVKICNADDVAKQIQAAVDSTWEASY